MNLKDSLSRMQLPRSSKVENPNMLPISPSNTPASWSLNTYPRRGLDLTIGCDCAGEPGHREHYAPGGIGTFVIDPDDNNIEVVHQK